MVDRFARTDLSTTAPCDTSAQVYCGGTWKGLISKLDYIQGMGFTAVWISPIVSQIEGNTKDGSSYHGYWAKDINSLNSAFGTPDDLVALSDALHARGMYLMVDVVTNHMGYKGCRSCVDYSSLKPFSSSSYYHDPCEIDYDDQRSVELCWQGSNQVSLPDLRTEDGNVRDIWNKWARDIVDGYKIDGLRVDSVKHVETSFWPEFEKAAGVFCLGEVFHGDPAYLAPYQNYMTGLLDYPSHFWITRAFQSATSRTGISELVAGIEKLKNTGIDTSLLGSFLENHDQARFAHSEKDMARVKNAIAFTMLKDGIPIIYQGQEQHYAGGDTPHNRDAIWFSKYSTGSELYKWIASLNKIRSWAIRQDVNHLRYQAHHVYNTGGMLVMRKGFAGYQMISLFCSHGSGTTTTLELESHHTGFTANQKLIDVMGCTEAVADSTGKITLKSVDGVPVVLYPTSRLAGSGICESMTGPANPSTSTSTSATTTAASTTTGWTTCTTASSPRSTPPHLLRKRKP